MTKTKATILIVDDEKNTREGLARALKRRYNILLAENGINALKQIEQGGVDLLLSDIRMPGMDGMTLLQRALAREQQPICILLTAYGSIETAIEAMRCGASDFITKPVNLDELEQKIQRALRERELLSENRNLHEQLDKKYGLDTMIGESSAMDEVYDMVRQVAPSRANVLVHGESGTGKELVAQALHRLSPRCHGPFVPVHCAALPDTLLESELFGHEKGAFTGANNMHKGRFERADGGTLFLDEIGEIDPTIQVKLLRVLEERRFERLGGSAPIDVDVRLVAATNRNLWDMVQKGEFREDLYYRLNVISLRIPPLRERIDDIPLLLAHFLEIYAAENEKIISGITAEAMDALKNYGWPGNVRELRNKVESMVVLARGDKLSLRDIPMELRDKAEPVALGKPTGAGSLKNNEHRLIQEALHSCNGNRSKAAERLGISRRTIHRKIKEFDLD